VMTGPEELTRGLSPLVGHLPELFCKKINHFNSY
jgi:hypothetical protein